MPEKPSESPVRIIGSRELHKNLPSVLRQLQQDDARFVLTVHGRPRAVLIGTDSFLKLLDDTERGKSETLIGLQLTALLGDKPHEVPIEVLERALDATDGA